MKELPDNKSELPPEQRALREKCVHPSGTFIEFPIEDVETSIPARFEQIARLYPDRLAVKLANQTATYGQLNATANKVAFAIAAQKGTRSEPVALMFRPGIPLLAAMLGALKAAKALLCLNPFGPLARALEILDDCQIDLVLADEGLSAICAPLSTNGRAILPFESTRHSADFEDRGLAIAPSALALLSSTSGTSGKPKQVMQSHRNVLHNVMLRTNLFRICKHDRIGVPRSVSSGALMNYLLALLNGAGLFPFDAASEGTTRIPAWLVGEKVTFVSMSVPLFRHLPDDVKKEKFSLRALQFASQSVHRRDVQKFKEQFSKECLLINCFSSSETGPLAAFVIDPDDQTNSDDVPIGFPMPDKEILLLNSDGRPAEPNQVGEIVVRSRYLSRGYWRDARLTAEKFAYDPDDDSRHRYFTGDLALRLPDGCLVYKGRKDFRVKIRGYGVEIAEVENALRHHPEITETVVVALRNDAREDFLIAYVVSSTRAPLPAGEMRAFLKESLPDYMIPARFVLLERMPMTMNDKIDRRALPDPDRCRPELQTPYLAPRTAVERELAVIWSDVLAVDAVGVRDGFFDLGGNSLAASRAVGRVIETFQLEQPVKTLFEAPTIEAMAAVITRAASKEMTKSVLNRKLGEVEALSEEEAERLLAADIQRRTGKAP